MKNPSLKKETSARAIEAMAARQYELEVRVGDLLISNNALLVRARNAETQLKSALQLLPGGPTRDAAIAHLKKTPGGLEW